MKFTKKKLKKMMKDQFGVAESSLMIAIDAITQAVIMKKLHKVKSEKDDREIEFEEFVNEVSGKFTSLASIAFSNYFKKDEVDNDRKATVNGKVNEGIDRGGGSSSMRCDYGDRKSQIRSSKNSICSEEGKGL